jgi:hypothetical protein
MFIYIKRYAVRDLNPILECMFGSKTTCELAILRGTELDVGTLGMNHEESVLFSFKTHFSFVC